MRTSKPHSQWKLADWTVHYQRLGYSQRQSARAARKALSIVNRRLHPVASSGRSISTQRGAVR
jgi:hypothetical protein